MRSNLLESLRESPGRLRRYGTAAAIGGVMANAAFRHNENARIAKEITQAMRNERKAVYDAYAKNYPHNDPRIIRRLAHRDMKKPGALSAHIGHRGSYVNALRSRARVGYTAIGSLAGVGAYGTYRLAKRVVSKLRRRVSRRTGWK